MGLKGFTRAAALVASAVALTAGVPALAQPVSGQSLPDLDLWSLTGERRAFGADLWEGTSPDLARAVLTGLGDRPMSPAAIRLAQAVLSSPAQAPGGAGDDAELAGLRIAALLAVGGLHDAANMAGSATDQYLRHGALAQPLADTLLWRGNEDRACRVEEAVQQGRDAAFWLRLRAFCQLAAGNERAARLTLGLWRETGEADPAYERLMSAALDEADAGAADASTALNWMLSRRLELERPGPQGASRAFLASVGRGDAAEAVWTAYRQGIIDERYAAVFYGDLAPDWTPPPPPAEGEPAADPVAEAAAVEGAMGQARLYRMIEPPGTEVTDRAVVALLARAQTVEDWVALSRLVHFGTEFANAAPADATAAQRARLAVGAALAGEAEAARGLFSGVVRSDGGWDAGQFVLLEALIAAADPARAGSTLDRLVERGATGDANAQGAALLLAALGAGMTPDARAQFAAFDVPRPRTTPARLTALSMAGEAQRKGETALLVLSIVRQQPDGLSLADRAVVVSALTAAGMTQTAHDFAMEGLLALALPAL